MRPLVWLGAVLLWLLTLFALGHDGDGATMSATTHFLLMLVLCFRPRRPVRAE